LYTPRRRQQLSDWAFPCSNDSNNPYEASEPTYENDDNDTITLNSSLHDSAPVAGIDEIADGFISWKPRPSSPAPRQDVPRHRGTVVAQRQVPSSSSSTDQGFIISKIFTQKAHSLRRWPKDENGNICPNAAHDYTRYEHLITTMKLKQLDVYFVQETWLEGDVFDKIMNRYHIFRCNGEIWLHLKLEKRFCYLLSGADLFGQKSSPSLSPSSSVAWVDFLILKC
jgi:hypothetical protein